MWLLRQLKQTAILFETQLLVIHLSMVFGHTIYSIVVIGWHSAQAAEREVHPRIMQYKTLGPTLRCCEGGMEEDGVPSPNRPQGQKREQGVPDPRKSRVVYIRW